MFERETCPGEGGITKETVTKIASLFLIPWPLSNQQITGNWLKDKFKYSADAKIISCMGVTKSHNRLWLLVLPKFPTLPPSTLGKRPEADLAIFVYLFLMVGGPEASLGVIFFLLKSV